MIPTVNTGQHRTECEKKQRSGESNLPFDPDPAGRVRYLPRAITVEQFGREVERFICYMTLHGATEEGDARLSDVGRPPYLAKERVRRRTITSVAPRPLVTDEPNKRLKILTHQESFSIVV